MDFICRIPKEPPRSTINQRFSNRPPLQQLQMRVKKSQTSAFADGTLKNLTYQWVKYLDFCFHYQFQALPAEADILCLYAQSVADSVKSHQTVLSYVSGVKTLHYLLDLPTTGFDSFMFRFTLRGMNNLNRHVPNQAPPMTAQSLAQIRKLLDLSKEEDMLFWTVLLIGFYLLLRKCNLVPDSSVKFDPEKQLKRGDLTFCDDHVKVLLRWTKNNQFKQALRFALPRIPGSLLCPVDALVSLFTMVQGANHESVFKRSNGTVYTYRNLQSKLEEVSNILNMPQKFTSHSLRAGGATNAFLAGVPADIIKVLGFWKSDCYQQYIRLPEQARLAAGVLVKHRIQCLNL